MTSQAFLVSTTALLAPEDAMSISRFRLALLHISFYFLCLLTACALHGPVWLLLVLAYCGIQRRSLVGARHYPSLLWGLVLWCLVFSWLCSTAANIATRLLHSASVDELLWTRLTPLWMVLGGLRWDSAACLDTIVTPTVATITLGVHTAYMLRRRAGGLRVHRIPISATLTGRLVDAEKWAAAGAFCSLATAPLMAALAWVVAWMAPATGLGFLMETVGFVYAGTTLHALRGTQKRSAHRGNLHASSSSSSVASTSAVRHVLGRLCGTVVATMVIVVTAAQNDLFAPFTTSTSPYALWSTQLGVSRLSVREAGGVPRLLQLLGMCGFVAGMGVVEMYTGASSASSLGTATVTTLSSDPERIGLLVVEGEIPLNAEVSTAEDSRDVSSAIREDYGGGGLNGSHHDSRRSSTSSTADRPRFLRRVYVRQLLIIAYMLAALLYALCFPCVVSLAVWLVHLCCSASGVVVHPTKPSRPFRWSLVGCLVVLSFAVAAQYACLVLRVNPATAALAWPPALPAYPERGAAITTQAVVEHVLVLLLGLYVCTVGLPSRRTPTHQPEEAQPASSLSGRRLLSAAADAALISTFQSWAVVELRNADGRPTAVRAVFETAVGRLPRPAELEALLPTASVEAAPSFSARQTLSAAQVFTYMAAGPLYTGTIIVSLFVLGTSGSSMDLLHVTCLVCSLLFTMVGSTAVLYRRLRYLPPVWVALMVGLQLCYHVLHGGEPYTENASSDHSVTWVLNGFPVEAWTGLLSLSRADIAAYTLVQAVLLWCCRYQPRPIRSWARVWQCLLFRCQWSRLIRRVHRVAGFVVLLWIVVVLPRSASVAALVVLLFTAALFHHWGLRTLVYVWQRYLLVGYCGVVLLVMLLSEFTPVRPRLWRLLDQLGCPPGEEESCAQDCGLASEAAVWLTPVVLPWWIVTVLATAAGSPRPLPSHLVDAAVRHEDVADSSPDNRRSAERSARVSWWRWTQTWLPLLLLHTSTIACYAVVTVVALHAPSVLTACYLLTPLTGVHPSWTYVVAAVHTTLQCTYQLWYSPKCLDTYQVAGTSMASLLGLWRATDPITGHSATRGMAPSFGMDITLSSFSSSSFSSALPLIVDSSHWPVYLPTKHQSVPSTWAAAAAPLVISVIQGLRQQQWRTTASNVRRSSSSSEGTTDRSTAREFGSFATFSVKADRVGRLLAAQLSMLLLLVLLWYTQGWAMGWVVGALLVVVWRLSDLRACGVLLRPRWRYRLCMTVAIGVAMTAFALHWVRSVFPQWWVLDRYPYLTGGTRCIDVQSEGSSSNSSEGSGNSGNGHCDAEVKLLPTCWVALAMCIALRWSCGPPQSLHLGADGQDSVDHGLHHRHVPNLITWLRLWMAGRRHGAEEADSEARAAPKTTLQSLTEEEVDRLFQDASAQLGVSLRSTTATPPSPPPSTGSPAPSCALQDNTGATTTMLVVQVLHNVPLVACAVSAVGAASAAPPSVLTTFLLLIGLLMGLRHARLQWTFWQWWRPLVCATTTLPVAALALGCPGVRKAVSGLPPWAGLLLGTSEDGHTISASALTFTGWHVVFYGVLWIQSCLYNNPQWGLRLVQLQYTERGLGQVRHVMLEQQIAARARRATEDAERVDAEMRAYLEGLRAGEDMTNVSMNSATRHLDGPLSPPDASSSSREGEEEVDEIEEDDADVRAGADGLELGGVVSPRDTLRTVIASEEPSVVRDYASAPAVVEATWRSVLTWRWWQSRLVRWLRAACDTLANHTYHPSEYKVGSSLPAVTSENCGYALHSLLGHLVLIAVQVVLRHTPHALLLCVLVNALLTGCVWELVGLCYLMQIALAYHPHAPRIVYQCFGFYTVTGILMKEIVVMWEGYEPSVAPPPFLAWTLLSLKSRGTAAGLITATAGGSGRDGTIAPGDLVYTTLWMDLVTVAMLVLHQRVCSIHGIYVAASPATHSMSGAGSSAATAPSSHTTTTSPPLAGEGKGFGAAIQSYCANITHVPGVGKDWYMSYTLVDFFALLLLAVTYGRMTGNEEVTLQDNVLNNQLPGPMALLLCTSVLQLVVDRMLYVERCMRLKAVVNWICAVFYCFFYWRWRTTVSVTSHAAGNAYFSFKVVALVFSVAQVCHGYPLHRRRDAFTTHRGSIVSYSCFMIYRAIPFLWELRTLIDWTVQHTALTLQEYLTLEDVYVYMYNCRERYVRTRNGDTALGEAVHPALKWLLGVSRLVLILLALLAPLLYYSTYNPSSVANQATQLDMQLSFFGAHDFFTSTVRDNVSTPEGWWLWLSRTRPTLASYGQAAVDETVQLMEFTSCSGNLWMPSPQAVRQVLAGLRAAAAGAEGAAFIHLSTQLTRSASASTTTATVAQTTRWPIPRETAQTMVSIFEQETGMSTTVTSTSSPNSSSSGDREETIVTAVLPNFYTPFTFNRASRMEMLPVDGRAPNRNRQHCSLELHHERDAALSTMVRYWCLQCTPLFPRGNVPTQSASGVAEWRCLTTGEGCERFNYEDAGAVNASIKLSPSSLSKIKLRQRSLVPLYLVVLSDSVVVGLSFLRGIGIVALYTTFVLALGRLLRSVLANKGGTLILENMANPAVLETMVRCIAIAREYGDLRLEHSIYLELIDLLRSPERLFKVTGSLRCLYADAGPTEVFRFRHVRRRRRVAEWEEEESSPASVPPSIVSASPRSPAR